MMADTPQPGTPEWNELVQGVANSTTADKKGWAAQIADDDSKRGEVVKEIRKNGRR